MDAALDAVLHVLSLTGSMTWEIPRALGLVPDQADAKLPDEGVHWNCTTWLNIVLLLLAAAFVVRFLRTGGIRMLRMMGGSPAAH